MVAIGNQKCDFCGERAVFDAKTSQGSWAYMCSAHYQIYAVKVKGLETPLA